MVFLQNFSIEQLELIQKKQDLRRRLAEDEENRRLEREQRLKLEDVIEDDQYNSILFYRSFFQEAKQAAQQKLILQENVGELFILNFHEPSSGK